MNIIQKNTLKQDVISRNSLYELQGSRFKRLLKDPVRSFTFYIKQTIGYIHPYKVHHKTLWGADMSFFLPEGGMIYYYGFWEANLTNFFVNFLQEGDIFFDVGAHVGYYSVLASDLVGDKGKVYSFEPTPRTFASLKENTLFRKNAEIYNNAILDKETVIDFFDYGPKYSAFNSFKKRTDEAIHFKEKAEKISVSTISLDSFCKEKKITPTFIKIDAEGAESFILNAMKGILTLAKPVISIEVSSQVEWKKSMETSFSILRENGYVPYEITLEGNLISCNEEKERFYDNLIFAHTSTDLRNLVIEK
jgi:FkbM family methyltransferase